MGEIIQLGALLRKVSVLVSESRVAAAYDFVDPRTGVVLADGGELRICFAALDAINRHIGGTEPELSIEQRIDLAVKFFPQKFTVGMERVGDRPEPERQDVTVVAHAPVRDAVAGGV